MKSAKSIFLLAAGALLFLFPASSFAASEPTVIGSVEAIGSSASQITVLAGFTGDENRDGSVKVEYSDDSSWGNADDKTACEKSTGGSPRVCYISKLDSDHAYYVRVTYSDPDGVSGSNGQVFSARTRSDHDDKYPPTLSIIKPMDGGVIGGNSDYPVVVDFTVYDRHSGISESSGDVQVLIDGVVHNAVPNPKRPGYWMFSWTTPTVGQHSVTARARDKAGNLGYAPASSFYVNSTRINTNGIFAGDGKLLVRDNDNQICWDCHGGIKPHSSQHLSSKYGNWSLTCRQCHTPHNTNNIFLVREQIKTPNSGLRDVDFRVAAGRESTVPNAEYGFTNRVNPGYGPCETCHTKTSNGNGTARYRNTGSGPGDGSHKNPPFTTSPCIRCHDHKRGFSPLSPGNIACNVCHPKQFDPMNGNTAGYHMYIQNAETTALSGGLGPDGKYPSKAQPTQEDQHRRCIMCHADMDLVNDSVYPDTPGAAYNQRVSINVAPVVGDPSTHTNTDFRGDLPEGGICLSCHKNEQTKNNAKKKNDGTSKTPPWDVQKFGESAHNFTVDSSFTKDGTNFKANCAKCHNDDLIKDYQDSQYKFGLHDTKNRSLLSNINNNLTYTETSYNSTEEHFCYQCHSQSSEGPSDYNPNGVGSSAKDAYNVQPMKDKAVQIKEMFESSTKKSFHPINGKAPYSSLNGLGSAAGKHKVDEGLSLPSGVQTANWNPASSRHVECTDCHNPHAASKEPRNLITWRPNIYHPAGSKFSGNQMVEGSFGGQVGGANEGVWGVEPNFGSTGGVIANTYTKLDSSANIYQLCMKCHTSYAYGTTTKPQMPMAVSKLVSRGDDNGSGSTWSWSPGPETDISGEFNPNNYSFHPVVRRGRNQPAPHLNTNWPYFNGGSGNGYGWNAIEWDQTGSEIYSSGGRVNYDHQMKKVTIMSGRDFPTYYLQPGWRIQFNTDRPSSSQIWYEIKTVDSAKQITLVSGPLSSMPSTSFVASAGLGWAFVPPYGPWSTITCVDCHRGQESDPLGPHGSDQPWLLRQVDQNVVADANLNGVLGDSGDLINKGSWSSKRIKTFCYNCHRRDVYGIFAANDGVEPSIPIDANKHPTFGRMDVHPRHAKEYEPDANPMGIWCMTCHGGVQRGGLHGSNRGKDSGWGSGGSPQTPSGMRLRNGSAIGGFSLRADGGSCWTRQSNDNVSSCVMPGGAHDYSVNYQYSTVD